MVCCTGSDWAQPTVHGAGAATAGVPTQLQPQLATPQQLQDPGSEVVVVVYLYVRSDTGPLIGPACGFGRDCLLVSQRL
jgi:hypothetical protein